MVSSGVVNLAYDARKMLAGPHKKLIGEAAARVVPDHSSVFINIGTTTEEVARALGGHSGLLVITNNLHVATELYRNTAIEVFLLGGTVRQSDGGIVGSHAVSLIGQFRVDLAIIGTSAIDADGTLLDFDIREVQASRAIIEQCAPGRSRHRQQQVRALGAGPGRSPSRGRHPGDGPPALDQHRGPLPQSRCRGDRGGRTHRDRCRRSGLSTAFRYDARFIRLRRR